MIAYDCLRLPERGDVHTRGYAHAPLAPAHPHTLTPSHPHTLPTRQVAGPSGARSYTLAELKAMPQSTVTASLQCGGNRRGELNAHRKTSGNAWGCGAISNATWTGVRLRDVLRAAGMPSDEGSAAAAGIAHVEFEGVDGTVASIPAHKATNVNGDVLLACVICP